MFFKNISKKIDLIEQATRNENDIDKLEKKLKRLASRQKSLNKKILSEENNVAKLKSGIKDLLEKKKELNKKIKSHKLEVAEKNREMEIEITNRIKIVSKKTSELESLKTKWNELDATEQKLRRYFGDLL